MNENETINKLAWVTCLECGATFRVGVPANATEVKVLRIDSLSHYTTPVACPKCKHKFYVDYI